MEKKTRLDFIDIAKGLAILIVLLGHLLSNDLLLKKAIYAFHMPIFFIVAGFFIPDKPFKEYAYRRISTLIIPYLIFAMLFGMLALKNFPPVLYATNQSLLYSNSNGMLWFLPCLFLALMFSYLLKGIVKKNYLFATIAIVASLILGFLLNSKCHDSSVKLFQRWGLPFAIDIVLMGTAFVITGYLFTYHKGLNWLKNCSKLRLMLISLLVFVSLFSIYYQTIKGYPQMATGDVGNWYVYYIVAVTASLGLLAISQLIASLGHNGWIIWLGKNSLTLFLVHRMLTGILIKNLIHGSSGSLFLMYVVSFFILCLFSVLCTMTINKFFPYLVGKHSPYSK